jgi:hypothetical protein
MKTRELFDWALRQPQCLLVIDELDAVAPQRNEFKMHTDERRQVNEPLAQLDRIQGTVVVVGTIAEVKACAKGAEIVGELLELANAPSSDSSCEVPPNPLADRGAGIVGGNTRPPKHRRDPRERAVDRRSASGVGEQERGLVCSRQRGDVLLA